jgi:hypothetical protein
VPKPYFFLSILISASLLAGCAPGANAQPEAGKVADSSNRPADLSNRAASNPSDSAKFETVSKDPPSDCPLTVPQEPPFAAPAPYSPSSSFDWDFWYGSHSLWTAVPQNGVWSALPHNPEGYTQKIFWWSNLFSLKDELEPELVVTGERLDSAAPPLKASKATNASAADIGSAMLVGVDFPTAGCWKITGQYKKTELSFVVWVAP